MTRNQSSIFKHPGADICDMIRKTASEDQAVAQAAEKGLALAFQGPLREAILSGDVVTNLFQSMKMEPGASMEFPLDCIAPGEEDEFVAYTNPGNGRIPERQVEGDYVQVPTYGFTNSIDWLLRFARDARYDVVSRCMQVMTAGFTKKINDDGWHVLLAAAADRNILVYDADATAGQFTKRLVSLMKVTMRRNGGGNTASVGQSKLTDIFISPEGMEDIRNWNVDQIDETTRREIFISEGEGLSRIFGVTLNEILEFGEGQEYQTYFTGQLGGSLASTDLELIIGLDLNKGDSLIRPIRQEVTIFTDPQLHRQQRSGFYGWGEHGFAALDNRVVLCGSF